MQDWRSPFPWIGPKICRTCSGRLSLHHLLWDPWPGWTGNLSRPLFLSLLSWLLKNNDFCSDNNLYKGPGTRFSLSASLCYFFNKHNDENIPWSVGVWGLFPFEFGVSFRWSLRNLSVRVWGLFPHHQSSKVMVFVMKLTSLSKLYNDTEARFSIFASPPVAPSIVCVCVCACVCVFGCV